MKVFNAFQIVLLFAAGPFLIQFSKDATFVAHAVLFWILAVAYVVGFGLMVLMVADELDG